uniref:Nicastrin n=1 Tax=Anthurium amnicola TaxID=1678845 RepID=A0A1D1XNW5_9ARAE
MSNRVALPSLLLRLLVLPFLHIPVTGQAKTFESVPDLQKAMYHIIDGYPCVRLLNVSGEIGCSNPGRGKVVAPIVKFKNADGQLSQPSTLLVAGDEMQNLFLRISNDQDFAQNVAGVLVESKDVSQSSGFSPVGKFPQAEFAPYKKHNFEWNPVGSGIMGNRYNFPVFLLSKNSTLSLQEFITKNGRRNKAEPIAVAEFDLVMQTTTVGTHDSESCLRQRSCLPLGGYSEQ